MVTEKEPDKEKTPFEYFSDARDYAKMIEKYIWAIIENNFEPTRNEVAEDLENIYRLDIMVRDNLEKSIIGLWINGSDRLR